jgi:hypothetical protein
MYVDRRHQPDTSSSPSSTTPILPFDLGVPAATSSLHNAHSRLSSSNTNPTAQPSSTPSVTIFYAGRHPNHPSRPPIGVARRPDPIVDRMSTRIADPSNNSNDNRTPSVPLLVVHHRYDEHGIHLTLHPPPPETMPGNQTKDDEKAPLLPEKGHIERPRKFDQELSKSHEDNILVSWRVYTLFKRKS